MAGNGGDIFKPHIIDIEKRILDNLSEIRSSKGRNYRVLDYLNSAKPMCFEPEITAVTRYFYVRFDDTIGEQKKGCLKRLLERKGQETVSVKKLLAELDDMKTEVEGFYKMLFDGRSEGLETMLFDGVFIVELLRRCMKIPSSRLSEQDTTSLSLSQTTQDSLVGDLLLLQNQFPFFVLQKLFHMTLMQGEEDPDRFISLATDFLSKNVMHGFPGNLDHQIRRSQNDDIKHLLDLLHRCWRPKRTNNDNDNDDAAFEFEFEPMPCATELKESGIRFKKWEDKNSGILSLFDIEFKDGELWIPKLALYGHWEKIFLNLLAYEQSIFDDLDSRYVTDYVRFMAILIRTGKDVEFLRRRGVIDCGLGNDESVAKMFSKVANNVQFSPTGTFLYSDIFIQMQSHYSSRESYWNRKWTSWKAAFWHDYFSTPWGAISVIAAAFLLILTVLQTIFTILPYYHPH